MPRIFGNDFLCIILLMKLAQGGSGFQLSALYSQRYVTQIQDYHRELFQRMIAAGVMRQENPELLAMMYDCPILILLGECDRHPEREPEVMDALERHVRLFYQTFHREPSEEGGEHG